MKRVNQKPISGDDHWFPLTSACQNGVACVDAIVSKASPIIPDVDPDNSPEVISVTTAKVWEATVNPAMETVSDERVPATSPDP